MEHVLDMQFKPVMLMGMEAEHAEQMHRDVTLPIGTRMEKYEITAVLGQGAGGISYAAKDLQMGREVVIKEHFPIGLCTREEGQAEVQPLDEEGFARSLGAFCRESRILAGLKHASIVTVHDVFSACGTAYLIMEYVSGVSLKQWMRQRPSVQRIRRVLSRLLSTLTYMHGKEVIHRDIKPGNIMIQEGDEPMLIDFGAAMVGEPTHTLTLVGTPNYAAPEQFIPHAGVDARADLYALARAFSVCATEAGVGLPLQMRRTLKKASSDTPASRYASAESWLKSLRCHYLRWWMMGAVVASVALVLAWPVHEGESASGAEQSANALPVEPPMHVWELVTFREGKPVFLLESPLPPREEAFVRQVKADYDEYLKKDEVLQKEIFHRISVDHEALSPLQQEELYQKLQQEFILLFCQRAKEYVEKHFGNAEQCEQEARRLRDIWKRQFAEQ